MVNVLKFRVFFLFSNEMFAIRAGIHKMLVRIANREDPDQIASCSRTQSSDPMMFDLILYVPSTIFQFFRDGSSWVEPVLS